MKNDSQHKNGKQKSKYILIRDNWNKLDKLSPFSPDEIALFERLLRHATEVGFLPFKMSNSTISGLTRLNKDKLIRSRETLYEKRVLVRRPGGKGRGDMTCYEFVICDESNIKSANRPINNEGKDSNNDSPKDSKLGSENKNLFPSQDNNNLNTTKSSKEEEEKEEENFIKPTKQDLVNYSNAKNYDSQYAEEFFNINSEKGWYDNSGKRIYDWKKYFDNFVKKQMCRPSIYSHTFTHEEGLRSAKESLGRGKIDESEEGFLEFCRKQMDNGETLAPVIQQKYENYMSQHNVTNNSCVFSNN